RTSARASTSAPTCETSARGPLAQRGLPGGRAGTGVRFGAASAAGEEVRERQDRGTDGDRVRAEAPQLDRHLLGRVAQRVRQGVPADGRQEAGAEPEPGPAADEDALGLEQVDQVG